MKLRKKTGIMMATTAAVAVVGVAAVSFAAWTGSNTTFTATANTGDAYLFGFVDTNPSIALGKIVPWNQNDASIIEGSKIVSVKLPDYVAYSNYSITVESTTGLDLYVLVGAQQTTALNPTTDSNWKSVKKPDGANKSTATFEFSVDNAHKGGQTTYLSVLLVSTNYADHNQAYSLDVTLVDPNVVTEPTA